MPLTKKIFFCKLFLQIMVQNASYLGRVCKNQDFLISRSHLASQGGNLVMPA